MVISRIKKWLSKKPEISKKPEKRNFWYPWFASNLEPQNYDASSLPAVRRCVQLFSNLLSCAPVTCDGDEQPDWLKKPCDFLSRHEWLAFLTESYFIAGNFRAFIQRENGEIKQLLPFLPSSIQQFSAAKDPANPVLIQLPQNRYFQSQYRDEKGEVRGSKFLPEDILSISNPWGSRVDFLNGLSLQEVCRDSIELSTHCQDSASAYAKRNFIAPSMVSGLSESDSDSQADFRKELESFLEAKKAFVTLGNKIELQPLIQANLGNLISIVQSIGSIGISRIFNVPLSLLGTEAGITPADGGGALKESHRFFVRTAGRAYLETIGQSLSDLSGKEIKFNWKSFQMADAREASSSLPALQDAKLITPKEGKEWLS